MLTSRTLPLRAVAALTVAYSAAITAAPRLLARPTGLTGPDGSVSPEVSALVRSIGVRDAVLALALVASPADRRVLGLLTAARVVSDAADAAWFAGIVPDRKQRAKVSGSALGWAALEAGAWGWAVRR